jgi:hypothetical protein
LPSGKKGLPEGGKADAFAAAGMHSQHRGVYRAREVYLKKRLIDALLLLLFVLSVALVMLGIDDHPFARDAICEGIGFCPTWENKLIYDLGIGGVISLGFYFLLVRLPESERRRRIKKRFRRQYRRFKKDCIAIILGVADGTYSPDLVDELLDQKKFRDYFEKKASNSQEKWHVFLNELRDHNFRELLVTMEIFRTEILYVLNTTDMRFPDFFGRSSPGGIGVMRAIVKKTLGRR